MQEESMLHRLHHGEEEELLMTESSPKEEQEPEEFCWISCKACTNANNLKVRGISRNRLALFESPDKLSYRCLTV